MAFLMPCHHWHKSEGNTLQRKTTTHGTFGLANAGVAPLLGTLSLPAGARGVIINFRKSSFVIGCTDLKHKFHLYNNSRYNMLIQQITAAEGFLPPNVANYASNVA